MSGCHPPYIVGNVAYSNTTSGSGCSCVCHLPSKPIMDDTIICWCKCNKPAILPNYEILFKKINSFEKRLDVVEEFVLYEKSKE